MFSVEDETSVESSISNARPKLFPLPDETKAKGHSLFMEILGKPTDPHGFILTNAHIEKEESEIILEKISILNRTDKWIRNRQNDLVYEDHFNQSIMNMANQGNFSFTSLVDVCRKYENRIQFAEHGRKSDENYPFFIKKTLPEDDARATAFAIAFYTGSQSGGISRSASIIAREGNGQAFENIIEGNLNDAAIILYYLVKGLANIPYYWGVSARAVQLKDAELDSYEPGTLITWLQFSSSKKGYEPPECFARGRNTHFIIYSITGRQIQEFSIFPDEDEVLFLPHSTFLVLKHELNENKHIIYLRQVELGFSEWSVLWVDDHILDSEWENKEHMERAATRSLNVNVHFIPKSTTENALSFLRSPFGKRLKNLPTFRIVTDMKRDNEPEPSYAGIRLIKEVRKLGFQNQCLIFTSNKKKADEKIQGRLTASELNNLFVTENSDDLDRFVGF